MKNAAVSSERSKANNDTGKKDKTLKREDILFGLIFSGIVTVIGGLMLVLNAAVETWPIQNTLGVISFVVMLTGIAFFLVFGLFMLYHRLNEDKQAWNDDYSWGSSTEGISKRASEWYNSFFFDDEDPAFEELSTNQKAEYKKSANFFRLMLDSIYEIKGYYAISKQHAQQAFYMSVFFCLVGLALLAFLGFMGFEPGDSATNPTVIGIIVAGVSELFAGTALLVHRSAMRQLNIYYEELHDNEMLLTAFHLSEYLSKEQRNAAINKIIDGALQIMTDLPGATTTTTKEKPKVKTTTSKDAEGNVTQTIVDESADKITTVTEAAPMYLRSEPSEPPSDK